MSHVQRTSRHFLKCKEAVKAALRMDEQEYNQLVFEGGLTYLETYMAQSGTGSELLRKAMSQSKRFWAWYQNAWHRREAVFVEDFLSLPALSRTDLKFLWRMHQIVHPWNIHPPAPIGRDAVEEYRKNSKKKVIA